MLVIFCVLIMNVFILICYSSGSDGIYLPFSWVLTSELSCEPRRYTDETCTTTDDDPCFGCCYKQPPNNFEGPVNNLVVLQCSKFKV